MAEITLRKYHGLGNDYLIYDPNRNACELQERQVEALCRRNLGVGADGILYGPFFDGDKMRVRIFNPRFQLFFTLSRKAPPEKTAPSRQAPPQSAEAGYTLRCAPPCTAHRF